MKEIIANEQITATSVRVVDADNDVNTVMGISQALEYAYSKDLDLVQVSEQEVPVVKILDLNKYKYELKQEEKKNDKKQRSTATQIKEVQFSTDTQENDLNVKVKSITKFVSTGKQVRLVMKVVGRMSSNKAIIQNGIEKMNSVISKIEDTELVQAIQVQGNNIVCSLKSKQK